MSIVPTDIPMTSGLCEETIVKLTQRYPFLRTETLTTTAFGRPVQTLVIGDGPRKVLILPPTMPMNGSPQRFC